MLCGPDGIYHTMAYGYDIILAAVVILQIIWFSCMMSLYPRPGRYILYVHTGPYL